MDPQATLNRLRELTTELNCAESNEHKADIADEFSELFEGLDNWLSARGFLPTSWRREP